MKILVSLILGILISFGAHAQSSASDTFTSSMLLRAGITVSCGNMRFPDAVAGEGYGAGDITSGTVELHAGFQGGIDSACDVTGDALGTYDVTLPNASPANPINMTYATTNHIPIASLALTAGNLTGRPLTGGDGSFIMRGTLGAVDAGLPAGQYNSAAQTVTVIYSP